MTSQKPEPVSHQDALVRLKEGNQRFVQNVRSVDALSSRERRENLVAAQYPFAIVLSCSDSRVPSEIVFDCGLGDLFIVRVAGNIVAPSIVGSVEFAAASFGTQLVVVMGHTRCGAIQATIDSLATGKPAQSENLGDIVDRIKPSIAELVNGGSEDEKVVRAATRANVRASANHLRHGSRILEDCIRSGKLAVVGAEYELETGKVQFFDGV